MADVIGYIPGVWDLLHVGHVNMLENAGHSCSLLIVGVPSNSIVEEDKGNLPIIPLNDRLRMLRALSCVDQALPYYQLSFLEHLELIHPNLFFVSSTWGKEARHRAAEKWLLSHGGQLVCLPYYAGESTTSIKNRTHSSVEMSRK